jgi:hypothetical protein
MSDTFTRKNTKEKYRQKFDEFDIKINSVNVELKNEIYRDDKDVYNTLNFIGR